MVETIRLKASQIAQARALLQKAQDNRCALCGREFGPKVVGCLDHDHTTGFLRGVLCLACNRFEGQVNNRVMMAGQRKTRVEFLNSLAAYWEKYSTPQTRFLHPTHKTNEEKVAAIKLAAKRRYAAKKKGAK